MEKDKPGSSTVAIVVLIALTLATYMHEILARLAAYRALHRKYPFYVAESLDKIAEAVLCCLAIYLLYRFGFSAILRELGLAASVLRGISFAILASAPMLVGFALTRSIPPRLAAPNLLFLTVFSPIVEELEFRGFGFWQLYRRARWPLWLAILPPAILFALGHIEKGQDWREMASIFLLTGTGAAVFSWLLKEWKNLWIPIAMHICMNLWWEIFRVAKTAVGGWFPFALQTASILLAIVLTVVAKGRGWLPGGLQA
jgi:membrane protease YdiL (CAAX protease family)